MLYFNVQHQKGQYGDQAGKFACVSLIGQGIQWGASSFEWLDRYQVALHSKTLMFFSRGNYNFKHIYKKILTYPQKCAYYKYHKKYWKSASSN